eukprot:5681802-Ditylum_brightwellii.AAC.1
MVGQWGWDTAVFIEYTSSGAAEDQDAYNGELCGLYSIVCEVEQLCVRHKITTGEVTVGYNCIEALKKAMGEDTIYSCCSAQFSLILDIDNKLKMNLLNWRWRHMKGHQDDHIGPLENGHE